MAYSAVKDWDIAQGALFTFKMTIQDSLGAAIDLTGYTAHGQTRKILNSLQYEAQIICTIPDQSILINKGVIICMLPSQALITWPFKEPVGPTRFITPCPYDINTINPAGQQDRPLQGVFNVSPDVQDEGVLP